MRRFASVFLPKREKRESQKPPSAPPLGVTTLKIPAVTTPVTSLPPTPQLISQSSDRAQSSSSSTASGSIQTPDEDSPLTRSFTKKSFKKWFGTVKSGTLQRTHRNHSRLSLVDNGTDQRSDSDYPLHLPPVPPLRPPPPGNRSIPSPASRLEPTQPPASSLGHSSGDPEFSLVSPASSSTHESPPFPADVRTGTHGNLLDPLSSRPFAIAVGSPLYPRSCNPPIGMAQQNTLSKDMFQTRLLHRLQDGLFTDDPDVRAFTSRHLNQPRPQARWRPDISSIPLRDVHVSGVSTGIRRWISRPCFEDRFLVWLVDNGSIVCKPVAGTSFAVLDFEYSEYLEVAAGFDLSPTTVDPPFPQSEIILSPEVSTVPTPYSTTPSPLRHEHSPMPNDGPMEPASLTVEVAPCDAHPSSAQSMEEESSSASPDSTAPTVKRGVRWAEDVSDRVPVGYALRMKKRREDKAKFLHEEQSRRALEVEHRKIENARRVLEYEKRQREKERTELQREKEAWEAEKWQRENTHMEKQERREKAIRDEVINSRIRREAQRAGKSTSALRESTYGGLDDGLGASSGIRSLSGVGGFVTSSSSSSMRDGSRERNSVTGDKRSRLSHDPNMQPLPRPPMPSRSSSTSIGNTLSPMMAYGPALGTRSSNSNSGSSPGSSRPPSVSGAGSFSSNIPSSTSYDHSDEIINNRKRHSIASTTTRPDLDRASTLPNYPSFFGAPLQAGWNGSHPNLNGMSMVPISPMAAQMNTMMFPGMSGAGIAPYMDMPLLPPTPPFMMQQYPRRTSLHSSNSSRDQSLDRRSSRQRESSHGSGRSSGSEQFHHRPANGSSTTTSSPHQKPTHSRKGSADISPSSFTLSKRTSSGLSLDRYKPGPSSSSSSLANVNHRHSQGSINHNHDRTYPERGRSMHPGHSARTRDSGTSQTPSPWTALPTQNGAIPQHMPTAQAQRQRESQGDQLRQWTNGKPSSSRRQTTHS